MNQSQIGSRDDSGRQFMGKSPLNTIKMFRDDSIQSLNVDSSQISAHNESIQQINLPTVIITLNKVSEGENSLIKKTILHIFLESIIHAFGNIYLLYYITNIVLYFFYGSDKIELLYVLGSFSVSIIFIFGLTYVNKKSYHNQLKDIDNQLTYIYREKEYVKALWKDVCPGSIVKVEHGQKIPANSILFATTSSVNLVDFQVDPTNVDALMNKTALIRQINLVSDIHGQIQFDTKIFQKGSLHVQINNQILDLEITQQQKLKRNYINVSGSDILVIVYSCKNQYKYFDTNQYMNYQIDPLINNRIQFNGFLVIILNVIVILTLVIINLLIDIPPYLNNYQYISVMKMIYEFQARLIWGVPGLQLLLVYMILLISKFKINNDPTADPLLSGNKIKVYNSNVLNSLAEAKAVLVNVRSLTRPCRQVPILILNKMSDVVTLQNPYQLITVDEIEDQTQFFNDLKYPLLTLSFKIRSQDDISIQQYIARYNIIQYTKPNLRIIQNQDLVMWNYELLFEYDTMKGIFHLYKNVNLTKETYILTYRVNLRYTRDLLPDDVSEQLNQKLEDTSNIEVVFKKFLPKQYAMTLQKDFQLKQLLDAEAIKNIKQDLEAVAFIPIQDYYYDCYLELMDLQKAQNKVWMNTFFPDSSVLEDEPTLNSLMNMCHVVDLQCEFADHLQVIMEKTFTLCNLHNDNFYVENKPALGIIDIRSFELGLKNPILEQRFRQFLLQFPYLITLNFKTQHRAKLCSLVTYKIISVAETLDDVVLSNTITVSQTNPLSDVYIPNFSYLPLLILNQARNTNIAIKFAIKFQNYAHLVYFFIQAVYMFYNRFSWNPFYDQQTPMIYAIMIQIYAVALGVCYQDYTVNLVRETNLLKLQMDVTSSLFQEFSSALLNGVFHGAGILMIPLYVFYGTSNQNGYIHGIAYYQIISLELMLTVVCLKPLLELIRITSVQLFMFVCSVGLSLFIAVNLNQDLDNVFNYGFSTKDLCCFIFVPFCILFPNFFYMYYSRLIKINPLNTLNKEILERYYEHQENDNLKYARNQIHQWQDDQDQENEEDQENKTLNDKLNDKGEKQAMKKSL